MNFNGNPILVVWSGGRLKRPTTVGFGIPRVGLLSASLGWSNGRRAIGYTPTHGSTVRCATTHGCTTTTTHGCTATRGCVRATHGCTTRHAVLGRLLQSGLESGLDGTRSGLDGMREGRIARRSCRLMLGRLCAWDAEAAGGGAICIPGGPRPGERASGGERARGQPFGVSGHGRRCTRASARAWCMRRRSGRACRRGPLGGQRA